jgi:hypothetical protein
VRIAHLRGLPSDEFAEVAQVNVQRLFGPMNCG